MSAVGRSVKQIVNIGELRLVFTFLNWLHVVVWVVSRNYCYLNIDRNDTGNKTKVNSWSKLFTVIATVLIFVVFPRATLCDELADLMPMWCNLTECFSFHPFRHTPRPLLSPRVHVSGFSGDKWQNRGYWETYKLVTRFFYKQLGCLAPRLKIA